MLKSHFAIRTAIAVLAVMVPHVADADVFYIDPSATEDGRGTQGSPFNSWESVVWTPGNSYLQKRGTEYHDTIVVGASGSEDARIILGAYGMGAKPRVIVAGTPELFHIERSPCHGIGISDRSYITIRDLQIRTSGDAEAIYGMRGEHNLLEGLEIGPTGGHGVWLLFQSNLIVRNCLFHHAGALGNEERNWKSADNIHLESCHDYLVEFCESHDCHQGAEFDASDGGRHYTTGIWRYNRAYDANVHTGWSCYKMSGHHPKSSVLLLYNVAHNSGRGPGLALQEELNAVAIGNTVYGCDYGIQQKHVENVIVNNIVVGGTYGLFIQDDDFPERCENNLWYGSDCVVCIEGQARLDLQEWKAIRGGIYGVNSIAADPLFRNPDEGDFTLAPSSPAVGRGKNLGSNYQAGLSPSSSWPDGVLLLDQNVDDSWDVGAFIFSGRTPRE